MRNAHVLEKLTLFPHGWKHNDEEVSEGENGASDTGGGERQRLAAAGSETVCTAE